jgi:hypothetical protein
VGHCPHPDASVRVADLWQVSAGPFLLRDALCYRSSADAACGLRLRVPVEQVLLLAVSMCGRKALVLQGTPDGLLRDWV